MLLLLDLVAVVESQILCFMFLVVSSVSSLFTFLFSPRKHNLVIVLIFCLGTLVVLFIL